jgi:hypothetical protein
LDFIQSCTTRIFEFFKIFNYFITLAAEGSKHHAPLTHVVLTKGARKNMSAGAASSDSSGPTPGSGEHQNAKQGSYSIIIQLFKFYHFYYFLLCFYFIIIYSIIIQVFNPFSFIQTLFN